VPLDSDGLSHGNNWGCNTEKGSEVVSACRAECKSTHDAKRVACRDTYQTCSNACSGNECRSACRPTYNACIAPLRDELDSCAHTCVVETEGCRSL